MYQLSGDGLPASVLTRKPGRVTVTLNWALLENLHQRAAFEGRSLSNLIAALLERAVER